jgi:hypothetical protein
MSGSQAFGWVQTARSSPVQPHGPRGWDGLAARGGIATGASFPGPESPREPRHPAGASRWPSRRGLGLQFCLQGGWAGYSFGRPARPVVEPKPGSPVTVIWWPGRGVSQARSGPGFRQFGELGGGVNPAGMGTSVGTPGGGTSWPGKHHDWSAKLTVFRPLSTVLAIPPGGLRALPKRRIFLNRNGARKKGGGRNG